MQLDYYTLIGVDPTANADQIREAYLSRMRLVHPDRFDVAKERRAWEDANRLSAQINEAYSVLKDTSKRRAYDEQRGLFERTNSHERNESKKETRANGGESGGEAFVPAKIVAGEALFGELSHYTQSVLLARQADARTEQARVRMQGMGPIYGLIIVIASAWLGYLYFAVNAPTWNESEWYVYTAISAIVIVVVTLALRKILWWNACNLKNDLYVTPIYFIETHFDTVRYWPLWLLENVEATHKYKNGLYQHTEALFVFEGETRYWRIPSKQGFEEMARKLDLFRSQLLQHARLNDSDYFYRNDDFREPAPTGTFAHRMPKLGWKLLIPTVVFGVALLTSGVLNQSRTSERWHDYGNQVSTFQNSLPIAKVKPSIPHAAPELPDNELLPSLLSYVVQSGNTLTEIANLYDVKVEDIRRVNPHLKSPNHLLVGDTLSIPLASGNATENSDPEIMPHAPAVPEQLNAPARTDPLGSQENLYSYPASNGETTSTADAPTIKESKPSIVEYPEVPFPAPGVLDRVADLAAIAPLTVRTTSGSGYYFIKLVDADTGVTIVTAFAIGGRDLNLDVPLGSYKLRYANGMKWFGEKYLFGERTERFEAEDVFDFQKIGNQISGYTVELILQEQGNLETKPISPSAF